MIQKITKGFISFFKLEAASGIVLLFAAIIALIISNSELLITKAIIAAKRRTIPLAASNLKKDINPFVIF